MEIGYKMNVKFLKETPRRDRRLGITAPFRRGEVVSLPDKEARYYLSKGVAQQVMFVKDKSFTAEDLTKALGIKAEEQNKLMMPYPTSKLKKEMKNGEFSGLGRDFFKDKSINVKDIAECYLLLFDYAVSIKDSSLVSRLADDISTLMRVTKFYAKGQAKKVDKGQL